MFLEYHGQDIFWRNIVNAIFFVTLFICEIPTGAFADIFGRKASYVLSWFILALSMFIYAASSSFAGFIVAEIVAAIGRTFSNGAFDAWLKDKLDYHGCEKDKLRAIFSRKTQTGSNCRRCQRINWGLYCQNKSGTALVVWGNFLSNRGVLAAIIMKEEYFEKK